jgi:hypothetical protein
MSTTLHYSFPFYYGIVIFRELNKSLYNCIKYRDVYELRQKIKKSIAEYL